MSADSTTRKGKIARLPRSIREALNVRLHDGQPASVVLPWLNEIVEVKGVIEQHFAGEEINEQNLTNWRQGGYVDWCEHQAEADRLQGLAELSIKLVEATGLKISDGAAAIAAGNLLSKLEMVTDPDEQHQLIQQLVALRSGDHAVHDGMRKDRKLALDVKKSELKEREVLLAEDKFRRLAAEKVFDAATSKEAQAIIASDKPKSVKLEQLALWMFGEKDADVVKLTGGKAS
jgi:hypothetical protein